MINEQGSPFQLSSRGTREDLMSRDATTGIAKSLLAVSEWRDEKKRLLNEKDSQITALKLALALSCEKLECTEKEKYALRVTMENEIQKRAEVIDMYHRLEGALAAAHGHSERLQAISEQLPKTQKSQNDRREKLVQALKDTISSVISFKAEKDSLRKQMLEKALMAEQKELFIGQNLVALQHEEKSIRDEVSKNIADIGSVRSKLEVATGSLKQHELEAAELDTAEEAIRVSLLEADKSISEANLDCDKMDRDTAELESELNSVNAVILEQTDTLARDLAEDKVRQQNECENLDLLQKQKDELTNESQNLEERLSVLRTSVEAKKQLLMESKAALEKKISDNEAEARRLKSLKTTERVVKTSHPAPPPAKSIMPAPKKQPTPKPKTPMSKPALTQNKRQVDQVTSQESPSKRNYLNATLSQEQLTGTKERSYSRMSDSSDDSNVSVHVAMRIAPEDRPKIPANFGRLTRDDDKPRREYQTLDDF